LDGFGHRHLPARALPRHAGGTLPRTFGTHLSRNGVPLCTAQAATRRSSLNLTMNVYTERADTTASADRQLNTFGPEFRGDPAGGC